MRRLGLTLLAVWSAAAHAATETSVDAETGLASWQTETEGIQVRLTRTKRPFTRHAGFLPPTRNAMPANASS